MHIFGTRVAVGIICAVALMAVGLSTGTAATTGEGMYVTPWTDNYCGGCHKINLTMSHPIRVSASMLVPSSLPLDAGLIACTTCHEDSVEAHREARINRTPMLRIASPTLCRQCHDSTRPNRTAQHGSSLGKAHLALGNNSTSVATFGKFDPETRTCLTCHDGLVAQDSNSDLSFGEQLLPSEHPVAVSYQQHANSEVQLNPMGTLDPRIRLFDGNVGCGSCHNPYIRQPKLLVKSNLGSQLCLDCHRM